MVRLDKDPVGTKHPTATCCWCGTALVIAAIGGKKGNQGFGEVVPRRHWVCPDEYKRQLAVALTVVKKERGKTIEDVPHLPLPSQVPLYEAAREGGYLLWGGRAGPGKSTGLRWLAYWRSLSVPGHESLLLRENWDQLQANHTIKMAYEVPGLGGRWLEGDRRAVFGKGSDQSLIYCGHMAEADAVQRYLGIEYGLIGPDEASLYPVDSQGHTVLAELSTRARRDYVDRSGQEVKGVFLPTTNPGGPSAAWLKDMFIDHCPDFDAYPALRPVYEDGVQVSGYRPEQWRYIAATLKDNPYMRPDYKETNLAVLAKERYRQLAEGDWSVFAGQFFPEFHSAVHVQESRVAC